MPDKKLWLNNNKLVTRNDKILECDACPCRLILYPKIHCGCKGSLSGLRLGNLLGHYDLVYKAGAIQTQAGWYWNRAYPGGCYGRCMPSCHAGYIGNGNGQGTMLAGFQFPGGFLTASEAEYTFKDSWTTHYLDGTGETYIWYDDDNCSDNNGFIEYELRKTAI